MKTVFLKFSKRPAEEWELDLTGHGSVQEETECFARRTFKYGDKSWRSVRIGKKIDHIGSQTNRGGAVYQAEDLGPKPGAKIKDRSGSLFGGG